jgi:hypothetical protein
LRDLALAFALYWMERELGDFMEDGYMSARASELGPFQCSWFVEVVRPNAVSLVDARDFLIFPQSALVAIQMVTSIRPSWTLRNVIL